MFDFIICYVVLLLCMLAHRLYGNFLLLILANNNKHPDLHTLTNMLTTVRVLIVTRVALFKIRQLFSVPLSVAQICKFSPPVPHPPHSPQYLQLNVGIKIQEILPRSLIYLQK